MKKIVSKYQELNVLTIPAPHPAIIPSINTVRLNPWAKPDDGLNVKTTPNVWNLLPWMLDSPTTETRKLYLDWSLTKIHIPILLFDVYYCSSLNYNFADTFRPNIVILIELS